MYSSQAKMIFVNEKKMKNFPVCPFHFVERLHSAFAKAEKGNKFIFGEKLHDLKKKSLGKQSHNSPCY
jgi:7-cyano-7-deazaguanine synthase in queuosine biosynthesis